MLQAPRNLARRRQQERERARRPLPHDAELPVVEARETPDIGQVAAYQRQMMALVEAADRADPLRRIGVVEPASERVGRIGGIGDDPARAQQFAAARRISRGCGCVG